MARPFIATDEDILQAAHKVLIRRGPDAFSLAEVAADVGLSRAAIILRFKSTRDLKLTLLTRLIERFEQALDALPTTPGGDNALRVAAFIGGHIGTREGSARFFAEFTSNLHDRELTNLEQRRGAALHKVIANVLPPTAIDHEAAAAAFRAHLTGTIIAWLGLEDADARKYVVQRTSEWLQLAGIPFSQEVLEELSKPSAPAASTKKPNSASAARSKTSAAKRAAR